jgi:hypothetical protein
MIHMNRYQKEAHKLLQDIFHLGETGTDERYHALKKDAKARALELYKEAAHA